MSLRDCLSDTSAFGLADVELVGYDVVRHSQLHSIVLLTAEKLEKEMINLLCCDQAVEGNDVDFESGGLEEMKPEPFN
jgi:hypothetical protein